MRLFALALTLSLATLAVASAQTETPDSENGRYSFNSVSDDDPLFVRAPH
jgi:hypothetical protein